jgi:hypothetical protein
MAILRHPTTSNTSPDARSTRAATSERDESISDNFGTSDITQVEREYKDEAESRGGGRIDTGALLPKDLTVRLARVESANAETFIQVLYSITLTLFGLFLGSWVSASDKHLSFTSLEVVATVAFGALSLGLIVVWAVLKIRQAKKGVRIPYGVLARFGEEAAEQVAPADRHPATRALGG